MAHIVDRFVIHFFAAPGVLLAVAFALAVLCRRKKDWDMLPKTKRQLLVTSALIILIVTAGREAWDVGHGQPLIKVLTDDLSWVSGLGCGVWAAIRWDNMKASFRA